MIAPVANAIRGIYTMQRTPLLLIATILLATAQAIAQAPATQPTTRPTATTTA